MEGIDPQKIQFKTMGFWAMRLVRCGGKDGTQIVTDEGESVLLSQVDISTGVLMSQGGIAVHE